VSKPKHTPGPWEMGGECSICTTFDRECAIYPPTAGPDEYQYGGPIAIVSISSDSGDEANAHLIAAAPDLLAALQGLVDDITDRFDMKSPSTNPGITNAICVARAAIAKATGS